MADTPRVGACVCTAVSAPAVFTHLVLEVLSQTLQRFRGQIGLERRPVHPKHFLALAPAVPTKKQGQVRGNRIVRGSAQCSGHHLIVGGRFSGRGIFFFPVKKMVGGRLEPSLARHPHTRSDPAIDPGDPPSASRFCLSDTIRLRNHVCLTSSTEQRERCPPGHQSSLPSGTLEK